MQPKVATANADIFRQNGVAIWEIFIGVKLLEFWNCWNFSKNIAKVLYKLCGFYLSALTVFRIKTEKNLKIISS